MTYSLRFGSHLDGHRARFQFKLRELGDDEAVVSLNGVVIDAELVLFCFCQPPAAPAFRCARWQARLSTPPLLVGDNQRAVTLVTRDPARTRPVQVGEFELFIEGKSTL